jgi:glycosyltransferase involved in cell wall biosynthesis
MIAGENPITMPTPDSADEKLRIVLIAPTLPPNLDGIGDYTFSLAKELTNAHYACDVTVLISSSTPVDLIAGVRIQQIFDPKKPASFLSILHAVASANPHWVILQYNPFSYGHWGFNLQLPRVLARIKQSARRPLIAIMYHEMYVPVINWKFAIMATWQQYQFHALARSADVLMFSIEPWARQNQRRFPGKPIYHLPVGSNIERENIDRKDARSRLGMNSGEVVLGFFGTAHVSRLLHLIRSAAEKLKSSEVPVRILYIGPHAAQIREIVGDVPLIAEGPLSVDEVSRRLSAVDIYLATYVDGVSTRRGAMMAALQHEIAVVGTVNYNTDSELVRTNHEAMHLIPVGKDEEFSDQVLDLARDSEKRLQLGRKGSVLFERRFSWSAIAQDFLTILRSHAGTR